MICSLLHPQYLQPNFAMRRSKKKKHGRRIKRKGGGREEYKRERGEVEEKVKICIYKTEPQLRIPELAKLQMY